MSSIASTTLCGEGTNLTSGAPSRALCPPATTAAASAACRTRSVTDRVAALGGFMTKAPVFLTILAAASLTAFAQMPRTANVKDIVELELLTHSEVYDKIH